MRRSVRPRVRELCDDVVVGDRRQLLVASASASHLPGQSASNVDVSSNNALKQSSSRLNTTAAAAATTSDDRLDHNCSPADGDAIICKTKSEKKTAQKWSRGAPIPSPRPKDNDSA